MKTATALKTKMKAMPKKTASKKAVPILAILAANRAPPFTGGKRVGKNKK